MQSLHIKEYVLEYLYWLVIISSYNQQKEKLPSEKNKTEPFKNDSTNGVKLNEAFVKHWRVWDLTPSVASQSKLCVVLR